ncbi:MAG: hypothetical protein H8E40_08390 [Chloroflexi bacterium]|nr:hypothetical protein [Chloroflexota bacterium]
MTSFRIRYSRGAMFLEKIRGQVGKMAMKVDFTMPYRALNLWHPDKKKVQRCFMRSIFP